MGQSRNEDILENMLGEQHEIGEPLSRNEKILQKILGTYEGELEEPQSRIEDLLIQIYEQGGGGGGDVDVKALIQRTIRNITFPDGLTKIGKSAFNGCTLLYFTSLPPGITSIEENAFNECRNLALTTLPDSIRTIGRSAFYDCSQLALTTLPEGIQNIEQYTFAGCLGLRSMVLPRSLTSIVHGCFSGCTQLRSVTFQSTPTAAITSNVFANCANLLDIYVPWADGALANAPWGATNATIHYNWTGA